MAVEQHLGINSTENIISNDTAEDFQSAAKMFIYLNTCAYSKTLKNWFFTWVDFYDDLFTTKSRSQIILTLNRIMKSKLAQDKYLQSWNQKLFKGSASLLSLEYEKIQKMLYQAVKSNNNYVGELNREGI